MAYLKVWGVLDFVPWEKASNMLDGTAEESQCGRVDFFKPMEKDI